MIRDLSIGRYTFAARTVAIVVGVIIIAILALSVPSCLAKQRAERAQARADKEMSRSAIESGRDAVNTVSAANDRERDIEGITRENDKEIRNAEGANATVGRGVGDAGLDSLCRRSAYRDSERCRLRQSASR